MKKDSFAKKLGCKKAQDQLTLRRSPSIGAILNQKNRLTQFDKRFATFPTSADHGLCHFVFYEGSFSYLGVFFHFFASKGNVWYLFAKTTTFLATIGILTGKQFILFRKRIHDGCKRAEWTLFKSLYKVKKYNFGFINWPLHKYNKTPNNVTPSSNTRK